MKTKTNLAAFVSLFVTITPSIRADERPPLINTLPEITVTAPMTEPDGITARADRPYHQYTETDLTVAHERSVEEVLQGEPGLAVTKTDGEGVSSLSVRGAGGQGLMSLDGMPILYSLPGITNLNAVLPDGLQSVEVDRGFAPASQAFSAMSGSIRMTSRNAIKDGGDLRVEGGSFGFLRETLRGTLAGPKARMSIMANRTDVFDGTWGAPRHEGNPERDPSRGTQVLSRSDWSITEGLHWDGSFLYRKNWNGWDGVGINRGRVTKVDDLGGFLDEEAWLAQNTLTAQLTDRWISRLQLGYTQTHNQLHVSGLHLGYATDLYLARFENDQLIWRGDDQHTLRLLWGSEGRHERANGPTYTRTGPASFMEGPGIHDERSQQAGFLDARYKLNRLSGDVGIRHEAYSQYADQNLVHAGLAWQWQPSLKLKANGGTGYRIPSYSERLFPLVGQINLKPERGVGGDLGFEWIPTENLKLNLTGFYHRYDNLIMLTWSPAPTPERPCAGQCLFNIASATSAGLEAMGQYRFNEQWQAGMAYTYNDATNLDTHGRTPFESLNTIRTFAEWQPSQPMHLWMEVIYRDRFYNDIGNLLAINDNLRLNAHAEYHYSERLKFYVRGENLTDNHSPYVISLNQTGVAVYGGVMLDFK